MRLDRLAGPRVRCTAAHAALVLAIALGAAVTYTLAFGTGLRPGWIAADAVLLALCGLALHRWRADLGFSSLGRHRGRRLALLAAVALGVTLLSHWIVPHRAGLWLDETQYLEMARRGELVRHGVAPFSVRWLVPFLAGRWNVLPVDEAGALAALSFAGLVVSGVFVGLLLVRLRVRFALALTAPLVLACSYLGEYAAFNRALIDPFNYAMFALLLHCLLRREHLGWFAALLLLAAFNSEKAILWIPLVPLMLLAQEPGRWTRARWRAALGLAARACAPALLYTVAIQLYAAPARAELSPCLPLLHHLSFSALHPSLTGSCAEGGSFQTLWFPFGAFTVFALLGLVRCEPRLRPLALLLVAVFLQTLAATDTERMLAYSFIVYLPLGYVYLERAAAELPGRLARGLLIGFFLLLPLMHYGVPTIQRLNEAMTTYRLAIPTRALRMAFSALEVVLVGALIYLHVALRPGGEVKVEPPPSDLR